MPLDACATAIAPQSACARRGQHRPRPLPGEPADQPRAPARRRALVLADASMRACTIIIKHDSSMPVRLAWSQKPAEAACRGSRERVARSGGIAPRMAVVGTGLYVGSSLYAQQWTTGVGAHPHNTHETCNADALGVLSVACACQSHQACPAFPAHTRARSRVRVLCAPPLPLYVTPPSLSFPACPRCMLPGGFSPTSPVLTQWSTRCLRCSCS